MIDNFVLHCISYIPRYFLSYYIIADESMIFVKTFPISHNVEFSHISVKVSVENLPKILSPAEIYFYQNLKYGLIFSGSDFCVAAEPGHENKLD